MARQTDQRAGNFETENTGGVLTGFLADEEVFDRSSLWRLGSWGALSVAAVIIAVYTSQSSISVRRELVAATDLARQAQQLQSVARDSQNETRRLASAIDTLNGDRDRLYSRVTVLEQGMDSVTGAIARQAAAVTSPQAAGSAAAVEPAAQTPANIPAPAVASVATTVAKAADKPPMDRIAPEQAPATVASATPKASNALVAAKSMMAPPDAAATKLIEPEKSAKTITSAPMPDVVAPAPAADNAEPDASLAASRPVVQRTEFGIDLGGANSVGGLRALWRGLLKSRSNAALTTLRPIIVIRESNTGLGMQLRLVAGPLDDAAAAAKICAGLVESERSCETTVYDGQRLAMKAEEPKATDKPAADKSAVDKPAEVKPAAVKPAWHRRGYSKRVAVEEPAKKPDTASTLSSFFSRR